jgi:hypothetical protein
VPGQSGVGPRVNIVGAIVYWTDIHTHELKSELAVLRMWDGRTEKKMGAAKKRKHEVTEELLDYHGNVTSVEYEQFQGEMMAHFLENFWPMGFKYAYVHLDGARSHKCQDDRAPTKQDNMATMRKWLKGHTKDAKTAGACDQLVGGRLEFNQPCRAQVLRRACGMRTHRVRRLASCRSPRCGRSPRQLKSWCHGGTWL